MPRSNDPDVKESRALAGTNPRVEREAPIWPMAEISEAWMNMCMQMWAAWFQLWGIKPALREEGGLDEQERRNAGFPWLPQFETTIVPFHRRDDEAGAEGARLSMRLRVPGPRWAGESRSTVAFETLMPKPPRAPEVRH